MKKTRNAGAAPHRRHTIRKRECTTLECIERRKHHHMVHKIHKKHKISYKTLFYMKEYGPRSHVTSVIINESIKILFIASVISALGGVHVQSIKGYLTGIIPLLILLPALNSLIGSFGTIISSKFTTMLYMGKAPAKWWTSYVVQELIFSILLVGVISSVYIGFVSYGVSMLRGFPFDLNLLVKVLSISMLSTAALIGLIALISITWGLYIFQKQEDPNNFLIPLTTAIGDFGSMAIFSAMVLIMF